MKTILTKIEFHYSYLILALSFVITGYFLNLITLTSIIIIHELGHYLSASFFKEKVTKIVIYPYGGITKINSLINIDLNKELLISVSGFIFQWFFFLVITFLYQNNIIRTYLYNIFIIYHYSIFFFNILPIYPLDGSKILNIILNKIFNYKLSNKLSIIISLISIIFLLLTSKYNYILIMTIFILINNIYKYFKELDYLNNKFLLERYLYKIRFKSMKIIDNKDKISKNKHHLIKNKHKYIQEEEFLANMFDTKVKL